MENQKLILIETLCIHYQLEFSFFESLDEIGLITLINEQETICIAEEKMADLEKVIRLYEDLNVNLEGIDIIINLLQKVENLQSELAEAKNLLDWYAVNSNES